MRSRRSLPAAAAVTALAAAALVPAATATATATAPKRWHAVSDGPLSTREYATSVWTGKDVLVFGGDRYPCAPNAKCAAPTDPPLSDGAAYNPQTNKWRKIAKAPLPVPHASAVAVGRYVYALVEPDYNLQTFAVQTQTFVRYDTVANRWATLARPKSEFANLTLAGIGGKVIAYQGAKNKAGDRDFVWDAAAKTWRLLPADPKGPFEARVFVDVDGDAVVLGTKPGTPAAAGKPVPTIASRHELGSAGWKHHAASKIAADSPQWWGSDGLAVNATAGTSGAYTLGGTFDPSSGTWGTLPKRPSIPASDQPGVDFAWAQAGGGGTVVAGRFAFDTSTRTWRRVYALSGLRGYLQGPSVTWAGDRMFVWGGAMFPTGSAPGGLRDVGWTWSPTAS